MFSFRSNAALAASLVFAVALWGGNNAGTKWLIGSWPPIWTGGTRFLCAGLVMLAILRWTRWLGAYVTPSREVNRALWYRGGLSLAIYIVVFNLALKFTSASHVALYLGAAPVWALLWESLTDRSAREPRRYLAALLALGGVVVLLWPALAASSMNLTGELLGLTASVLWTNYGRQSRWLAATVSGAEVTAHTMWRAGIILLPLAIPEIWGRALPVTPLMLGVQLYCVVAGGVMAFGFWNNALTHWPTSRVLLFNNLIPLSTMTWAHFSLGEPITRTFWMAMALIAGGVFLGQTALGRNRAAAQTEL